MARRLSCSVPALSPNHKENPTMRKHVHLIVITLMLCLAFPPLVAYASTKDEITRDATAALENLYESTPMAKQLAEKAKGILVFPNMLKGGFIFGGQYGDGALFKNGKVVGY